MAQRACVRSLGLGLPARRAFTTSRSAYSSFDAAVASSSSSSSSSSAPQASNSRRSSAPSTSQRTPFASSSSSSPSSSIPHVTIPPPPPSAKPSPETELLGFLARLIMQSGKLVRAHSHIDLMLSQLQQTTQSPPVPILQKALEIVAPSIRIVGRKQGTKSLPTPQPLTEKQRTRQAWKWIVDASDSRSGVEKEFGKRLALEVMAVLGGQSEAIKKKESKHQQGVTGRANVGR